MVFPFPSHGFNRRPPRLIYGRTSPGLSQRPTDLIAAASNVADHCRMLAPYRLRESSLAAATHSPRRPGARDLHASSLGAATDAAASQ